MLKEERQQKILEILYRDGQCSVESLSQHFSISKDTIRRDLNDLEEQKRIKRSYGGAIPLKQVPLSTRIHHHEEEKYKAAKKALRYIVNDSVIAIDGGTTNAILASLIPYSMNLTVITNSFAVQEQLQNHPYIKLIFLGGECIKGMQITSGEGTYRQLSHFHFDACFIGTNSVDALKGISIAAPYEKDISQKRYIIENSDEVNVVCDSSKLDHVTNYIICSLDDIDRIIVDQGDEELSRRYHHKVVY